MPYKLGDVKPWVASGAELLGSKFGISNIGGWRAQGSVPGSDHPKGLALDLMTRSKNVGDRLADYAVANYKALGIKYVIWWRQIWTPGKGWKPYSGPSPHTDHVHVSFNGKAPTAGQKLTDGGIGGIAGRVVDALPGGVGDGISGIAAGVRELAGAAMSVAKVADMVTRLFLPTNLVRAAAGAAGTLFILLGIFFLSREARN